MTELNPTSSPSVSTNEEMVEVIEEAEARITASIAPNHRDMYILLAGLIVGFILSPWCAGRFFDEQKFQQFYFGSGEEWLALEEFKVQQNDSLESKIKEFLQRHKDVGATPDAANSDVLAVQRQAQEEQAQERIKYLAQIEEARRTHGEWVQGAVIALILAMAALMFLEPLFEPLGTLAALRNGLATGRYALAAAWLAMFVALPHARLGLSLTFLFLLIGAAILGAVLPWLIVKRRNTAN